MGKLQVPGYVKEIRQRLKEDGHIEDAVELILSENGIKQVPINAFDIARKLGFVIKTVSFQDDSISGVLWDGAEAFPSLSGDYCRIILLNVKESAERQLFTVAHELGHFMLHCNDETNFYERYITKDCKDAISEEQKDMEDKADFFAANLLLPRSTLLRFIQTNDFNNENEIIASVSSVFCVEKETIRRRLEEIGYVR